MAETFDDLLAALPSDLRITLVDIGSVGGIKTRWQPLKGRVHAICFDPREEGDAPRITEERTVYPVAVGRAGGRARLFVTRFGNMSSMLEPNSALLSRYRRWGREAEVTATHDLEVHDLDSILDGRAADALKVDTQGSELDILSGARRLLGSSLVLAEVEVSFFERYRGQPLFADILAFMEGQGFDFVDLYQRRRYYLMNESKVHKVQPFKGTCSGRLAYADAIFVLGQERLDERIGAMEAGERQGAVIKAMLVLLIYGKADIAARILERWKGSLDRPLSKAFAAYLSSL